MAAEVSAPLATMPAAEPATFLDDLVLPDFDPAIHLAFQPPAQRHTFSEVGLQKPQNVPDLCYTDPFPLFSEEGVRILRREMLSRQMLDNYLKSWDRAPAYVAGHERVSL
jgi:hypothetical protein